MPPILQHGIAGSPDLPPSITLPYVGRRYFPSITCSVTVTLIVIVIALLATLHQKMCLGETRYIFLTSQSMFSAQQNM